MRAPKTYRSIEDFEREEIRSGVKLGFSLDDLIQEATFRPAPDDYFADDTLDELDFD
jgi:hypothetical protein